MPPEVFDGQEEAAEILRGVQVRGGSAEKASKVSCGVLIAKHVLDLVARQDSHIVSAPDDPCRVADFTNFRGLQRSQ